MGGESSTWNRRLSSVKAACNFVKMTTTVEAIYENGKLVLAAPLPLFEKSHVLVTIESDAASDSERTAWLKVAEHSLMKVWDNSDDDVFNELLAK